MNILKRVEVVALVMSDFFTNLYDLLIESPFKKTSTNKAMKSLFVLIISNSILFSWKRLLQRKSI